LTPKASQHSEGQLENRQNPDFKLKTGANCPEPFIAGQK
jgi:hypothetical protein